MSKSVRMIGTAQTQKWHRTCTCGNMRTLNWTFEPLTWNHLKITCNPCTVLWNLKVIQGPTVGRPTPSISSWRWQVAPAKALADLIFSFETIQINSAVQDVSAHWQYDVIIVHCICICHIDITLTLRTWTSNMFWSRFSWPNSFPKVLFKALWTSEKCLESAPLFRHV